MNKNATLSHKLSDFIVDEALSPEQIDGWIDEASALLGGHAWRHVGHTAENPEVNNAGICEVASDKRAPVAEIIFNCMDATIELVHLVAGLKAPSPHAAARDWPALIAPDMSFGRVSMTLLDSGDPVRPTIELRDEGHGQHPDDIHRTFLSLHSSTKLGLPHLCGKFGMGLKSSFNFCRRLVLITRPHACKLGGRGDEVGVTVVRKSYADGDKAARYEYLCSPDGEIVRIRPKGFGHGSLVRLAGYDLEGFHGGLDKPNNSAYQMLNSYLIDPPFEISVHERREGKGRRNMRFRGLRHALGNPKVPNSHEGRFSANVDFEGKSSCVHVSYYVLHPNASPRDRSGTKVKAEQALTFSHNGQRHGVESRAGLRRALVIGSISERLAVVVDTSGLHPAACSNLYSSNRIEANSGSKVYEQIMGALKAEVAADETLKELDAIATTMRSDEKSSRTEPLEKIVSEMVCDIIGKGKIQATGQGASGRSGSGKRRSTDDSALNPLPTRIIVDNSPLKAPRGRFAYLTLDVDAKNRYLSPGDKKLSVRFQPSSGARVSSVGELLGGKVRLTVDVADSAPLGKSTFHASIKDEQNNIDMTAQGELEVVEPKKGSPGKGNHNGGSGEGVVEPNSIVQWCKKDDWPDDWDSSTPGNCTYTVVRGIPTVKILLNEDFGPIPKIRSRMQRNRIEAYVRRLNEYGKIVCRYLLNVEVDRMDAQGAFCSAILDSVFEGAGMDAEDAGDAEAEDE
jgi:hypothetical protein